LTLRPAIVATFLLAVLFGTAAMARQSVWGGFTSTAPNPGNSITAATDFRAPSASAAAIGKTAGGTVGAVKKAGAYYVYANVADAGNPASGISAVTANVSSLTSGATAVALAAGSYAAGGASYNYRSAAQTAGSGLAAGSYAFTLTMTDAAGNSATQSGFGVTVDNTAPAGSDVQTANGGTTNGLVEAGDTITLSLNEAPDPNSVLAGWSGAAANVVVRLNNGGTGNDTVTVFNSANATQLNLGSVNLGRTDYTSANITFGATGTASQMVLSGSTVKITLGTRSAAATTAAAAGTMSWTPSSTATDGAGNSVAATAVTETGAADKDF
jgi:hypothetical protein